MLCDHDSLVRDSSIGDTTQTQHLYATLVDQHIITISDEHLVTFYHKTNHLMSFSHPSHTKSEGTIVALKKIQHISNKVFKNSNYALLHVPLEFDNKRI